MTVLRPTMASQIPAVPSETSQHIADTSGATMDQHQPSPHQPQQDHRNLQQPYQSTGFYPFYQPQQAAVPYVIQYVYEPPQVQEGFLWPFVSSFFLGLFFGPFGLCCLSRFRTPLARRGAFAGVGTACVLDGIVVFFLWARVRANCNSTGTYYSGIYSTECYPFLTVFAVIGGVYFAVAIACLLYAGFRCYQERKAVSTSGLDAPERPPHPTALQGTPNGGASAMTSTTTLLHPPMVYAASGEWAYQLGRNSPIRAWKAEDVDKWLNENELTTLSEPFHRNSIEGDAMIMLTEADLHTMGVSLGRAKKFMACRAILLQATG
ncbi:hypothetical protein BC832DRAFT_60833 [Gaertneriomyces semiglobifer]|nr:hypothetical protein BC832DRAFT_60833 [Gaertneriomyces semiglobifer]